MATKMSSSSSRTTVSGCRRPAGGVRPGRVMSMASRTTPSSRARASRPVRASSRRRVISPLSAFSSCPAVRCSAPWSCPRDFISGFKAPERRPRKRSCSDCTSPTTRASANPRRNSSRRALIFSLNSRLASAMLWRNAEAPDGPAPPRGLRGRPGRLGGLHELREGRGIGGREIGERLAVELHARPLEARHELAVAQLVGPGGGVDADDPEAPEVALLAAPADEREVARAVHRLLGGPIELALVEEVALGQSQELLPPLPSLAPPFDSRHRRRPFEGLARSGQPITLSGGDEARAARRLPSEPLGRRLILAQQHPLDLGHIRGRYEHGLAERPLPALRLLGEDVALHGLSAHDLSGRGDLEALDGAPLGLQLQLLLRLSHSPLSAFSAPTTAATFLGLATLGAFAAFAAFASPEAAFFGFTTLAGASFLGARIWTMVIPSWRGATSMSATSVSSEARRSRMRRPISLCAISRPQKITVLLTLLPSRRKRSVLRRLNWKSCSSIFGRNLTSFTWMWRWCLRASESRFAC